MARPNEGAPPRAYRVFVASTFSDNDERRGLISEAITRAGMVPVLMDKQGAGALPPLDECLKKAREADLVVALLAWRYGSAAPGDADGRSYTECEIEAARDFRVFIIDPKAPIIVDEAFDPGPERWARAERLAKLKTRLGEAKLAAFWKETTLYAEVLEALRMWHAQQSLPQRDRRRRVAAGATPSDPARSSPPGSPTDATETWYRELLHERCSRLVLMGLEGAVLPVRREQLFVPLRIATGFAGLETPEYEDGTHAHHLLAHAGGGEAEVVVRRVFDEARLRGGRRGVVLLGDPGAGKTTVLQSCYLDLVESGPESYGLPSGTTPWLVYLRDLATSRKDLPSTLDETFRARWDVAPKGWFATRARADTVLLLLDGLDEIADEDERARVVDQIQAWLDSSPRRYAFLTSRYAGYHRRVRRASHLLELHLRFLSRVETHDLILRWFRAVEATTHPTPHEEPRSEPTATATEAERSATGSRAPLRSRRRQSADELAADLIESVDSLPASDRIVGLSRNPLLLGAICLVHRERGRLPRSRSTLYRTCIDILLQHWKQASGIKLKLSATEARSLLIPMAGFLHEVDGRTRATVKELAAGLRDRGMPDLERNALADFLRTVKDESGLVSGLGNGKFGFLHLGFQEYLAARDLVRRAEHDASLYTDLATRLLESWWEEVLRLVAAQARAFEPLFDALLARVEDVETSTATERLLQEVRPRSPAPFLKVLNGKRPRASAPPTPRQDLALRVLRRSFPDALRALAETRPGRIPAEARGDARPRASSLALPVREIRDGFEAVLIPAGVFTMGSPGGEPGRLDNEFQHEVELSAFAISRTCVTNRIYDAFRLARPDIPEPPSRHQRGFDDPECPVTSITWDEARKCAQWLGGDLPTEAQWEYACRSGKTTAFSTGASPDANFEAAAWFSKNSGGTPHPVAQKAPNAWGLFDVHGNVWEWCRDWCGEYPLKRTKDPEGPPTGAHRVLRGGSYWNDADWCRSAFRWGWGPGDRNVSHGFRVAFPAFPPSLGEPRSSNLGH